MTNCQTWSGALDDDQTDYTFTGVTAFSGTSVDTDGANLASQDEAMGQAMGESLESESEMKDTENTSTTEENTKSGIADVMAKILGKTVPKNKNPVLAKGQTDREIQRRKRMRDKETGKVGKKSKKSKDGDESSDWTDASDDDSPESRKKAQLKMQKVGFRVVVTSLHLH